MESLCVHIDRLVCVLLCYQHSLHLTLKILDAMYWKKLVFSSTGAGQSVFVHFFSDFSCFKVMMKVWFLTFLAIHIFSLSFCDISCKYFKTSFITRYLQIYLTIIRDQFYSVNLLWIDSYLSRNKHVTTRPQVFEEIPVPQS